MNNQPQSPMDDDTEDLSIAAVLTLEEYNKPFLPIHCVVTRATIDEGIGPVELKMSFEADTMFLKA